MHWIENNTDDRNPRSQKLELRHKTLSNTLAVKGLITNIQFNFGSKDQGYKIEGPDLKII